MLAGMYVTHDGNTWQVGSLSADFISGPNGLPQRAVLYGLAPLLGGPWRYVRNPDVELTPACEQCDLPAGHGACAALGRHQGPRKPAEPVLVAQSFSMERHDTPCGCWRDDCGECMRRTHQGERMVAR